MAAVRTNQFDLNRCFSSSNQLRTTLICAAEEVGGAVDEATTPMNCLPFFMMSYCLTMFGPPVTLVIGKETGLLNVKLGFVSIADSSEPP